ncbi:molybdopterin molybdotransferase MoeA [Stieleria varia]|uniref:Molybdopterin molybdenumtransferase n=1 Tax=Stieleria varia TaxID=2528005 RepID=A0A5C6B755_9BACT|nr:molybdopterin molybdotransferase MoeA [Stieleria varia]TWU07607.1 Molybdopterin molybdenumtransferase [Stieleria varia]
MPPRFSYVSPESALNALACRLQVVQATIRTDELTDRVIAQDVVADRDSPAADVSAMDGYAISRADLHDSPTLPVSGESSAGSPPPQWRLGTAVRIFTGAILPVGCDAVIKREETQESESEVTIVRDASGVSDGENIRCAGENAAGGSVVMQSGTRITAAQRATLVNFGCLEAIVFEPVRIAIVTTGDEVGEFRQTQPEPWQLRNSNQAALQSLIRPHRWMTVSQSVHCLDDPDALTQQMQQSLIDSDVVVLTGGVSMGDYDHVPDAVVSAGAEIVFHGLPIRPGKPILGAVTGDGKLVLGLPGNPVSATVCGHRFLLPLAAKISGQVKWKTPSALVKLVNPSDRSIPLHWMKLVRLVDDGLAEVVASQGSGDLVSLGQSDGYVCVPPDAIGPGPWPYFGW